MRNPGGMLLQTVGWLLLTVPGCPAHDLARAVPVEWARDNVQNVFYFEGIPFPGFDRLEETFAIVEVDGRSCIRGQYLLIDIADDLDFGRGPVELVVASRGRIELIANPAYQNPDLRHLRVRLQSEDMQERTVRVDAADLNNLFIGHGDIVLRNRREPFTLCDIRLAEPVPKFDRSGESDLTVLIVDDVTGEPSPARIGIFDDKGRPWLAGDGLQVSHYGVATTILPAMFGTIWPAPAPALSYTDGVYRARLPAGDYSILAMRGPEYRVARSQVKLRPGASEEVRLRMKRWTDQAARGWHSGDVHVHIGRGPEDDARVLTWMKAEDVHVANLLQMGNLRRTYFPQYAWGEEGTATQESFYLVPGQEDPRTGHRGHAIGLRLQEPIRLLDSYFLYQEFFQEVHRQGGIAGYAHFGVYFNGERGLYLDTPFDDVDFIEVIQFGRMVTEPWYRLLNLGYRLAPAGGSDFPYGGLPGTARSYVQVDGKVTPAAWNAGLVNGRTFVTNGPLLEFEVNGYGMGAEVALSGENVLSIQGSARVNPDLGRMDRVELLANGRVVRVFDASTEGDVSFREQLQAATSMWLSIRAYGTAKGDRLGEGALLAHSAPVYVVVDGGRTGDPCLAGKAAQLALRELDDLMSTPIDPAEDWEAFETSALTSRAWATQRPELGERVARAREVYEGLLHEAHQETGFSPSCWYRTARKRVRWTVNLAGFGALVLLLVIIERIASKRS